MKLNKLIIGQKIHFSKQDCSFKTRYSIKLLGPKPYTWEFPFQMLKSVGCPSMREINLLFKINNTTTTNNNNKGKVLILEKKNASKEKKKDNV